MDTTTASAQQLGDYYRVNGSNFLRAYKEHLSNFRTWDQLGHCSDWVLLANNIGDSCCIDETMIGDDLVTIFSNRMTHGRKGSVIAMVKGTAIEVVSNILFKIPEEVRNLVTEVTMDFSESMKGIVNKCFPNAITTLDNFHISKQLTDCIEEVRLKYKRLAVADRRKQEREFRQKKAIS